MIFVSHTENGLQIIDIPDSYGIGNTYISVVFVSNRRRNCMLPSFPRYSRNFFFYKLGMFFL